MKEPSTVTDLLQQIRESAGAAFFNQVEQRSFSLNIFQMNAVALIEEAQRVKDPNQGVALMMEQNREAGRQAHRELDRHVHNFVSSALTLVEHTRVFMRGHYAGTELFAAYEKQVKETFAQSPVAQFVQGLRNYMLHKGLPNSSMFMKFTANPSAKDGSGTTETGVRYNTVSLLDWKKWTPVARSYLEQAGEHLDVHQFAQEYMTLINQFYGWLDATLEAYHQSDIQELSQLQVQLKAISPALPPLSVEQQPDFATAKSFEFTSVQAAELNQMSSELMGKIRELHFLQRHQGFPTERPTTTITDQELIGPVTFWGQETSGEFAFMFIRNEDKAYGFSGSDYSCLDDLIDAVLKSVWARASLSREFIKKTFCDWARQGFGSDEVPFTEALSTVARKSVMVSEVWAPIANMEVEHGFDFGSVRIEPITAAVMENLRSKVPLNQPEQEQQVSQLFEKLRHEIQGFAAVVVSMEVEPTFAQERALQIAQDAVGLLRFFSPASSSSFLFSPVALKGAEYIPKSELIVLSEGSFVLNQSNLPKNVDYWRLPKHQIAEFESGLLDIAASLLLPEDLSEFALAVRTSLLTYSKGTTLVAPMDRLRNSLSAIEGVLLKHEMEPRAHCITNRMSFLLARGGSDRDEVKQIVQQIFWLLGQPQLTSQGHRTDELLMSFTSFAHDILLTALRNISTFSSKSQFVTEVDRLGLST